MWSYYFELLRNLYTDSQRDCTGFHSHWQWLSIPISHILASILSLDFLKIMSDQGETDCQSSFNSNIGTRFSSIYWPFTFFLFRTILVLRTVVCLSTYDLE